jgi:hypothetical protein
MTHADTVSEDSPAGAGEMYFPTFLDRVDLNQRTQKFVEKTARG